MTPTLDSDEFLTRREADILVANTAETEDQRNVTHLREHTKEVTAVQTALEAEAAKQAQHNIFHDKAHEAHEEKHRAEGEAVRTALAAVDRERAIHAEAHVREHEGHQREHALNNLAIDKAESATDKRFEGVNNTRAQMDDILRNLTSQDAFDALVADFARHREDSRKDLDRRFEEIQKAITNIEKGDVKAEGKGLGQSTVIAIFVTIVTVATGLLGTLILVANFITKI